MVGDWSEDDAQAKMFLELRADNTFGMVVGNQIAAGAGWGKYEANGDRLTLHVDGGGNPSWNVRWINADEVALTSELDPGKEQLIKRISRVPNMIPAVGYPAGASSTALMGDAQESALATSCLSNLKQMSIGALIYAQDFDGKFVDSDSWQQQILPYTKSDRIFSCPALTKQGKDGGYAMNSSLSGAQQKQISDPQNAILFFEVPEGASSSADPSSALQKARHNGTISFVFADGHASGQKEK